MLEERLLQEFAEALRAEATEKQADMPADASLPAATALAEVIIGYLEESGSVAEHDLCPHQDSGGHRPCRIIALALPEDSVRLDLFTCGDPSTADSLPKGELSKLSGWAARFFEYAAKGDHARFAGNTPALDAAARIRQELARIEEVRVNVLTEARVKDREVVNITVLDRLVTTEVWDLDRLYRATGEDVTRDRIEIDFVKLIGQPLTCLEMRPRPKEYETFLCILPGRLIYQLFDQYGPRLFEFNVRSFLQARGAVNRGIQRTIKEEAGRFLAYNNGLTATADEIEVGLKNGETVIKRIRGLQIVNGAQTTASIHRAHKVDKTSIDDLAVSMKLTLVPPAKLGEFVPLIARYANTQNPIQVADLSASDKFHQDFESLSETVWPPGQKSRWFYERARGSYQMARNLQGSTPARRREFDRTHPSNQHFGKTDVAKYLMTWWGFPQVVSRGAQKNYSAFMFSLRDRLGEDWTPDKQFFRETIAKAILFRTAQAVVRRAKLQSYGANVVTYMIALLAAKHGDKIKIDRLWESQEVSDEMQALLASWAPMIHSEIISSAGNRNVTEWCKKDDCWTELQQLTLLVAKIHPPELGETVRVARAPDHDEPESPADQFVEQCMEHNGIVWAKVMAWAAGSRQVDEFDRKVVHTLSGYAMSGWVKAPSPKQAVRGARVLSAARAAGILED